MADKEITPEIIDLVLRTSRVRGSGDIYALAPRGFRVGFYFQQRRATLLAAAIRSRFGRERLRDCPIAIVGGGISGLTFLLAITNEGAQRAYLYESEPELMMTGKSASHRLVHPNYNRWPLLGSMDIFTTLPMLNWYATSSDRVIAQLQDEITSDHSDLVERCVRKSHRVTCVTQQSLELANPLRVTFVNNGKPSHKNFRIVVVAAGFDRETSTTWGFDDYWNPQNDLFDRKVHQRKCNVYGTGDGALIDVIRLCAKDPTNAWTIPLGTIARLRSTEAVSLMKDRYGRIDARMSVFTEIEKKIQAHEESIRCVAWGSSRNHKTIRNQYTQEERSFYMTVISEVRQDSPDIERFLENELKPIAPAHLKPVLIGALRCGFEPTSAPINKLLLAYLISTNRVEYVCLPRKVQEAQLKNWMSQKLEERAREITVCRFGAKRNFPLGRVLAMPFKGIAAEIENVGTIGNETDTESNLVDALSGLTGGEYIYFDAMPHPMISARYGIGRDAVTQATRRRNTPLLERFAREHLGASAVEFKSGDAVGAKWVVYTDWTDEDITRSLKRIGGLDGVFFGAPIVIATPAKGMEENI